MPEARSAPAAAGVDALFRAHERALFGLAYRLTGCAADAEEVVQETFVRAYFKIARFEPRARFGTWLHQIALNLARDHSRSKHVRRELLHAPLEEGGQFTASGLDDPRRRAERLDRLQTVQAAIDSLPEDLKGALILTALEGMSHEEAAVIMETTPKGIEGRIYRARNLLKEAAGLRARG